MIAARFAIIEEKLPEKHVSFQSLKNRAGAAWIKFSKIFDKNMRVKPRERLREVNQRNTGQAPGLLIHDYRKPYITLAFGAHDPLYGPYTGYTHDFYIEKIL